MAKVGVLELVKKARLETKSRSCHNDSLWVKIKRLGAGETAQQLKALVLLEDLSSVSSTSVR